uniref:Centriolar and ciliogenesis-associated protein HYLS1 C-terminal domain-containing protein n=1 Tax=Periophthalmus magnuspinnatus TaxID=409849 RepID=A0A3B3ZEF5_9GOBI
MDNLEFSEEEIQQQLELLGYKNVSKEKLQEFKKDLDNLIRSGEWTTLVSPENSQIDINTSPPAFTKEKGFFLHPQNRDHDNRDVAPPHGHFDSYVRHSVAPKPPVHVGHPNRLQTETDPEDTLQTDSYMSTPGSGQGRRLIKRKVLRKYKGQSLVCDESVYSEDSASCLEERLADIHLSTSLRHKFENEELMSHSESPSSESLSEGAFESYVRGMVGNVLQNTAPQKTVFRTQKTDPVAKYFQYKQLWDMFKMPGENDRKALRWEVRERLAYQPPPPKPQKVLVPNTYTVPTDKKRSTLRWEIRNDLATGNLPHSYNYRF